MLIHHWAIEEVMFYHLLVCLYDFQQDYTKNTGQIGMKILPKVGEPT